MIPWTSARPPIILTSMPVRVGPHHYQYFTMLHRRRLWLAHLAYAFAHAFASSGPSSARLAGSSWPLKKAELDARHADLLRALSTAPHLGIRHKLPFQEALDDTPVESFLAFLTKKIATYERELLETMLATLSGAATRDDLIRELEQVSRQWGRELAQECLMTPAVKVHAQTLSGFFELYYLVLEGGDFTWKPLLLRRSTNDDLQYELRNCPHRRHPQPIADILCRLESMLYKSFSETLLPNARYRRHHRPLYCADEVTLDTAGP